MIRPGTVISAWKEYGPGPIPGQKLGLSDGYVNLTTRLAVFATHGTDCYICGRRGDSFVLVRGGTAAHNLELRDATGHVMTLDHVRPRARGGSSDISNLRPCCASCNAAKAADI